jgi:plasmid stabilization system protein ParE
MEAWIARNRDAINESLDQARVELAEGRSSPEKMLAEAKREFRKIARAEWAPKARKVGTARLRRTSSTSMPGSPRIAVRRAPTRLSSASTPTMLRLAKRPGLGRRRRDFRGDPHGFTVAPWLVVYAIGDAGILVLRILDSRATSPP